MPEFEIHSQLLVDCHRLGRFDLCHVLLHKNALLPWFILVPESDMTDLLELPDEQRITAINETGVIAQFIKRHLGYQKINFAAIGNVVPQLHLHVVGRKPDDPCWPAPVWGNLPDGPSYNPRRIEEIAGELSGGYGLLRS
ncbi:MAG TPA: HIT domain-containing protein [Candidatus Binatus sp.]|nr:HIT domain-containing protein [Candidatus Binatus sp.]